MKQIILSILILFMFSSMHAQSLAQENQLALSIPSFALLSVETSTQTPPTLLSGPVNPVPAGAKATVIITPGSSDNTWINYSSIVPTGSFNTITVNISAGQIPPDTEIVLETLPDVGVGAGETGLPIPEVILNESPQYVISSIGSCYTGAGANKGHKIKFKWITGDPVAIANCSVEVTFTITAGQ